MFGRKCTLCGGKLDGRGICTECGLDNNKADKNYKINESSCDDMPFTHVHEEPKRQKAKPRQENIKQRAQGMQSQNTQSRNPRQDQGQHEVPYGWQPQRMEETQQRKISSRQAAEAKKQNKGKKIFTILTIILTVAGILIGITEDRSSESLEPSGTDAADNYDPYAYVTRELSEQGESVEYSLTSGNYIVGVHIPEGTYEAFPKDDFDAVRVDDDENGIYLFEYTQGETDTIKDIRLYEGATLTITSKDIITLKSKNAQDLDMAVEANPLTEGVELASGETKTAGVDFAPGIYDVELTSGYGIVEVQIYGEGGQEWDYVGLDLEEDGMDGSSFRYLVLPEQATIFCKDDLSVTLTPSEKIESTDYFSFYQ